MRSILYDLTTGQTWHDRYGWTTSDASVKNEIDWIRTLNENTSRLSNSFEDWKNRSFIMLPLPIEPEIKT